MDVVNGCAVRVFLRWNIPIFLMQYAPELSWFLSFASRHTPTPLRTSRLRLNLPGILCTADTENTADTKEQVRRLLTRDAIPRGRAHMPGQWA